MQRHPEDGTLCVAAATFAAFLAVAEDPSCFTQLWRPSFCCCFAISVVHINKSFLFMGIWLLLLVMSIGVFFQLYNFKMLLLPKAPSYWEVSGGMYFSLKEGEAVPGLSHPWKV